MVVLAPQAIVLLIILECIKYHGRVGSFIGVSSNLCSVADPGIRGIAICHSTTGANWQKVIPN